MTYLNQEVNETGTPAPKPLRLPSIPAPPDPAFNAAKRLYAEQFGSAAVTNTYLKLALAALSLMFVAHMLLVDRKLQKTLENFKPLVIRIDSVGRAESVRIDTMAYKPQAAEVKYFLTHFCHLYYGRSPFTIRENFQDALLFMDAQLADATLRAWSKAHVLDNYLANSPAEQRVNVQRVDIEDLRAAPYKATVTFEIIHYSPLDGGETKRIQYTAHFVFGFREDVPNNLIQQNPLGMAISYFREDEAFH